MRIKKLQKRDTLFVIEDPLDIFYLIGERVSRGLLFVHPEEAFFLVDSRYLEACQGAKEATILLASEENEKKALKKGSFSKVVLSGSKLSYDRYQRWHGLFSDKELINEDAVRLLRLVKDPSEIEAMRRSAKLNREAMDVIAKDLKVGVFEEVVAWEFEKYCREKGALQMAFTPHVAFGENSSKPHYKSGKRALKKGDAVLIDTGVVLDSYVSDRTRSFLFSGQNSEYDRLFSYVKEAHDLALEHVKVGVPLKTLAELVNNFFEKRGVKELYKHNLGHSLGLEVHEYPTLSPLLPESLVCQEGMIFTIEPGLYLDKKFGIRHENSILVTKDGGEIL